METMNITLPKGQALVVLPLWQYEDLKLKADKFTDIMGDDSVDDPLGPDEEAELARMAEEQIALLKSGKVKTISYEDIKKMTPHAPHPIRSLREWKGLTAVQLAKKSGVGRVTITHIENRVRKGTLANYKAIAKALGVKVDNIIEWSDR